MVCFCITRLPGIYEICDGLVFDIVQEGILSSVGCFVIPKEILFYHSLLYKEECHSAFSS